MLSTAEVVAAFMAKDSTGHSVKVKQSDWQTPYRTLLTEVESGSKVSRNRFLTKNSFDRRVSMGLNFLEDTLKKDAERAEEKRIIDVASQTSARTDAYNSEYKKCKSQFDAQRAKIESKVLQGLEKNTNYTGSRSAGVRLALKEEIAVLSMGAKGSMHLDKAERQTILQTGKLSGYHGHHIKNVSNHPNDQGNPDNIIFVTPEEHLKLHRGDFRNPTEGKEINRDRMLQQANTKRVVTNEIKGMIHSTVPDIACDLGMIVMSVVFDTNKKASVKQTLIRGGKSALKRGGRIAFRYLSARLLQSKTGIESVIIFKSDWQRSSKNIYSPPTKRLHKK